ncbi:MAG: carbonic anhydrase [Bacteroidales bacterium]|jgi:carbonic anhydrase
MHHHHDESCCRAGELARRQFLHLALVGGAIATVGSAIPFGAAQAGGHAEALLLSCMDYRLVDDIVHYMDARNLTNNYDHVVLAGGALGAVSEKLNWGKTFWDHLDVAIKLHHVKKVIILDHKDCGAYRVVFEKDYKGDEEIAVHREQAAKLRAAIKERHPDLEVESLIMDLDGKVQPLA